MTGVCIHTYNGKGVNLMVVVFHYITGTLRLDGVTPYLT